MANYDFSAVPKKLTLTNALEKVTEDKRVLDVPDNAITVQAYNTNLFITLQPEDTLVVSVATSNEYWYWDRVVATSDGALTATWA